MKISKITALKAVENDLLAGKKFYDLNCDGIGSYFYDSLLSDIESLFLYAGIHSKRYGFYRMLSKKFPFAVYYVIKKDAVIVTAVLDMRRNPKWIFKNLKKRYV